MKTVYYAGWNMPGYMPEMTPERFDTLEDAREFIREELDRLSGQPFTAPSTELERAFNWLDTAQPDGSIVAEGLAYWITAEQVQTCAEAFAEAFRTRTRDDGTDFVAIADDAPSWMRDAVREAHGGALPHDWIWRACQSAVEHIAEHDDLDEARDADHEFADGATDVAYHALATWLADVPGSWDACAEWEEDMAHDMDSIEQRLKGGQYCMLRTIYATLLDAIETAQEEADEEGAA